MLNAKEANVLRDLAQQYMEFAVRPQQRELEKLWIALAHNTGSGVRPMVLVDQIPWHEMNARRVVDHCHHRPLLEGK